MYKTQINHFIWTNVRLHRARLQASGLNEVDFRCVPHTTLAVTNSIGIINTNPTYCFGTSNCGHPWIVLLCIYCLWKKYYSNTMENVSRSTLKLIVGIRSFTISFSFISIIEFYWYVTLPHRSKVIKQCSRVNPFYFEKIIEKASFRNSRM